jgi:ABC-type cobalamin transport system permease subunit
MILSYLVGDNPLFRLAVYVFVGVSAGYAGAVAWYQVLWPKLFQPLVSGGTTERLLSIIPLLLGILLLAKLSPRSARLGNPAMAYLVGVAAAVAVGGAVLGTLFPQVEASTRLLDVSGASSVPERLFEGSIVLAGTITSLVYFHFGAKNTPAGVRRGTLVELLGLVGQVFIAFAFGALFAGVYAAAMTALIERVSFLWTFLASFY